MYIRIVTSHVEGLTHDEYVAQATAAAEGFARWEGLLAKFWLGDEATGRYGGVYLFTDAAAAHASRSTPEFAALLTTPVFTDLRIDEFEVLAEPTTITSGVRASVVRAAA